jgi:stage II sporulation protein D
VEVAAILAALGLPAAAPDSVRLLAMARTPSARLRALRIETGHRGRTVSAEAFRGLLGYHRVRSACFEWSSAADGRIRLAGVGAGHGVGLCQAGAGGLGAQGRSYIEILAHYYPGSHLARLPPRLGLG